MQKKHKKEMESIKINIENLNKVTKILLNNIKTEFKNTDEKKPLFYIRIDNKKYYYSYNKIDEEIKKLNDSYKIVDYKKAKLLLKNQIQTI